MRILFVCMGNICRSPTAEGVMRGLLREEGLEQAVEVQSAGTGGWHAGSAPDARAVAAARSRDVVIEGEARQVTAADFERFDLLLAMDRDNERELLARAPDAQARAKVRLLRDNVVIHEGTLSTLKRFKDEVAEVKQGMECGMAFANYQDIREDDEIECFQVETIARSL